jgi:hypothetical protein
MHMTRIIRSTGTMLTAAVAAFALTACDDSQMPNEPGLEVTDGFAAAMHETTDPQVAGRTISNIEALLEDGTTFTGRIINLTLELVEGEILASGRLIGQVNGDRINEVFEGVALDVLDGAGDILPINGNGNGVCPILFLELGPIFLDVLGLIVEVPDPIVVEIRAERGPGQLLGNLLCALLGILD